MARLAAAIRASRLGRLEGGLKRFVSVPFQRQTYVNLTYLLLAFPLGLAYFVFSIVGVSVGISLAIILVGFLVLAATFAIGLGLAGFERVLTDRLLAVDIDSRTTVDGDRRRDQLRSLLTDWKTWSALLYLPVKFVFGLVSFVFIVTAVPTVASMLLIPLYYDQPGLYVGVVSDRAPEFHQTVYIGWNYLLVGVDAAVTVGHWQITTLPEAILAALLGIVLLFATLHAINALARLWARFSRVVLDGGYDPIAVFLARVDR